MRGLVNGFRHRVAEFAEKSINTLRLRGEKFLEPMVLATPESKRRFFLIEEKRRSLSLLNDYGCSVNSFRTTSSVCRAVRLRQGQALFMRAGSSKKLRAKVKWKPSSLRP
jgi:hypothetical protein